MRVSAAFAPSLQTPDHIRVAEDLGYGHAWVFDTPHLGSDVWMTPRDERHLSVMEGHLTYMNDADHAAWDAGAHVAVRELTLTGTPDEFRRKVRAYADQGMTELVYRPTGDIERELRVVAAALGISNPARGIEPQRR